MVMNNSKCNSDTVAHAKIHCRKIEVFLYGHEKPVNVIKVLEQEKKNAFHSAKMANI